jgi:hypothetical protein
MLALALFASLFFVPSMGLAQTGAGASCGDFEDLERTAFKATLSKEQRSCLEGFVSTASPNEATRASFVLITNAFMGGESDVYAALLRRHITLVNTTDADVAYMYAILLEQQESSPFERLRWIRVAIENRVQWAQQVRIYRERMKRLYHMRNEAGLETLVIAEQRYANAPSSLHSDRVTAYRDRVQHWTKVSSPCLVNDDCGPYWDVEVIENNACEDLTVLEGPAAVGKLTDREVSCLKGRWIRMPLNRGRVLRLLTSHANGSEDPAIWAGIVAWYHNEVGHFEPGMALQHARYLARRGDIYASEVLRWSQVVIDQAPELTGRRHRGMTGEAMLLRQRAQQSQLRQAQATHARADSVETTLQLEQAERRLGSFAEELATFCDGGGACPEDWRAELP